PSNSQFERTHRIPAHAARFAHKLLSRMSDVPTAQREAFLSRIDDLIYKLWDARALDEFKRLGTHLRMATRGAERGGCGHLARLGTLPVSLLRLVWHLWRVRTRQVKQGVSSIPTASIN